MAIKYSQLSVVREKKKTNFLSFYSYNCLGLSKCTFLINCIDNPLTYPRKCGGTKEKIK